MVILMHEMSVTSLKCLKCRNPHFRQYFFHIWDHFPTCHKVNMCQTLPKFVIILICPQNVAFYFEYTQLSRLMLERGVELKDITILKKMFECRHFKTKSTPTSEFSTINSEPTVARKCHVKIHIISSGQYIFSSRDT